MSDVQDRPRQITLEDSPWVIDITDRPAREAAVPATRDEAWRPGPLAAFLAERSAEQRGMPLASGFAVFAFLYGPLGILAVVTNRVGPLLVASLVIAAVGAVLLAPRPTPALMARRTGLVERLRSHDVQTTPAG